MSESLRDKLKKVEEYALSYKCTKDNIAPCIKEISSYIEQKEKLLPELKAREIKFHNLQLANKVGMNALYGYMGTTTCRFYYTDVAEGITSVGQEESLRVQEVLEKAGYNILYGDSVAGYCRVPVKDSDNNIYELPVEELYTHTDYELNGKEYCIRDDLKTMVVDDKGKVHWKQVKFIMRHKVNKKMYRIHTRDGKHVDVTEDHSVMLWTWQGLKEATPIEIMNELINEAPVETIVKYDNRRIWNCDIVKVEEIEYDGYVYDVAVDGIHNFFANGILVHNTDSMFILVEGIPEEIKDNIEEAKVWIKTNFVPKINEIAQKELEQIAIECGIKNPELDKNYYFKFKQEMIARSGIFIVGSGGKEAKKRYDLWVIDEEGVAKDKFTHAGTPMKQSKLPQVVKDYIIKFLDLLLKQMVNDEKELIKIPHELRDIIREAAKNWDLDKIGTTVQYNKPFEEYDDNKKDVAFVKLWNDKIVPAFKLPEFLLYTKYKFIEVKPKLKPDLSICENKEQEEAIKAIHKLAKDRNLTLIPIVDHENQKVIDVIRSVFDIDVDYVLEKYVVNIFKPYFLTLKIPVEKILYDFDLDLF